MLFINILINSYKTIVNQGDDKPKVKMKESNSLPIVRGTVKNRIQALSKISLQHSSHQNRTRRPTESHIKSPF